MSGLSARTPLRVKLVAAVVALAALGLLVAGTTATASLNGYLLNRIDSQLVNFQGDGGAGRPGGGPDPFTTIYVGAFNTDGTVSTLRVPTSLAGPSAPKSIPARPVTVHATRAGEADWRVIGKRDRETGDFVLIGMNLGELQSTTHQLEVRELVIGGLVLLVVGAVGYVVVRRSLRPLVAVESTAEAIAAGDLTQRVPESDPRTEVGSVSHSFNAMLSQIETAFAAASASESEARASEGRMRRFIGDASHELRTPLTSIRGFAELYRQGALPAPADVDRAMSRVESEAMRMGLLVEDLLMLARLDQQRPLEYGSVDLLQLAGDAVQDARAVDPARSVELEVVAVGPAPVVQGDAQRLRQVFGNLVSNAITHTPAGTPVVVRVSTDAVGGGRRGGRLRAGDPGRGPGAGVRAVLPHGHVTDARVGRQWARAVDRGGARRRPRREPGRGRHAGWRGHLPGPPPAVRKLRLVAP